MKNILKNRHIKTGRAILVLLTILCSLLFIVSCPNPFIPSSDSNNGFGSSGGGGVGSPRMGTFRLQIADSQNQIAGSQMRISTSQIHSGRTIVPDFSPANLNYYRLQFGSLPAKDLQHNQLNSIQVPVGNYSLTVHAYTSAENRTNNRPAASGTTSVNITTGSSNSASVTLTPLGMTSGTGTFTWDIDFPADFENVRMDIQPVTTGTTATREFVAGTSPAPKSGENAKVDLAAGQYRITFTLQRPNTQPVVWRETLHVYQNIASHYHYIFEEAHFRRAIHDVTYNYNFAPYDTITRSYFFDEFQDESRRYRPGRTPGNWEFGGWYLDAGCNNKWDFTLTGDITLFAKWIGHPWLETNFPSVAFTQYDSFTPGAITVTITNRLPAATANATGIRIEIEQSGAYFELGGSLSVASLSPGGNTTFTVKPAAGLLIRPEPYTAVIRIFSNERDDPLEVNVSVSVEARWKGVRPVNTPFNSNSLIGGVPDPTRGWLAKVVTGQWLRQGVMIKEGSDEVIQLPVMGIQFTHSGFPQRTWHFIPAQNIGWTTLPGGIGRYRVAIYRDNSENRVIGNLYVEAYIPNNGVTAWFSATGHHYPVYLDGRNIPFGQFPGEGNNNPPVTFSGGPMPRQGFFRFPTGAPVLTLHISIDAYATYTYTEDVELMVPYLPYPIFQLGDVSSTGEFIEVGGRSDIFYWRECPCPPQVGFVCTSLDRNHFTDRSSISDNETIVSFGAGDVLGGHRQTSPNIIVRAYDPDEHGVYFHPAADGLDFDFQEIDSSHYRSQTLPLTVAGESVGTVTLLMSSHLQLENSNIITRVGVTVTYNFTNPEFLTYLTGVNASIGTGTMAPVTVSGSTGTITFTNLNHGPLTLNTEFVFPPQ
jgi:hypothetical protein